jgi:hypothetical protein
MEPDTRYGAAAIENSCRVLFPRPLRAPPGGGGFIVNACRPLLSARIFASRSAAARCGAANAAVALVNNNENTSAAVDGDAADRGQEGSDPLKPLAKAA